MMISRIMQCKYCGYIQRYTSNFLVDLCGDGLVTNLSYFKFYIHLLRKHREEIDFNIIGTGFKLIFLNLRELVKRILILTIKLLTFIPWLIYERCD